MVRKIPSYIFPPYYPLRKKNCEGCMNPFTETLLSEIEDDQLIAWVSNWDVFEALIIEVFREGTVSESQTELYPKLKQALANSYSNLKDELEPHWQGRQAGGTPIEGDPYLELLSAEDLDKFVENWEAMQLLPAAREAINAYLLTQVEDQGDSTDG